MFTLPARAAEILHTAEADDISYLVLGLRGDFLSGDNSLPMPADEDRAAPGELRFRDATVNGHSVWIAYMWVNLAERETEESGELPGTDPPGRRR